MKVDLIFFNKHIRVMDIYTLITKDDKLRTVQIGLKQLQSVSIDQVNITFAGAIIAVVPLVILLLFFQRQLVRGLTAGAVKG